ncbi:MAG TPA: MauE/DoxX family redox-associated membrane protein, partial [Verrucomicrobiae bacterium]|nr:MauE/DoxX family redox-associated membrane protein [Verrucomicrobiae bacterium]
MKHGVFALRFLLGALLLVAGALKAGHPVELAAAISGFRLLPAAVVGPLAIGLPFLEIVLGLYLVAGLFVRVVAAFSAFQFVVYGLAIASAVLRHIPANCGCF